MLSITAKVRTLAKELDGMINLCADLLGTLIECSGHELIDKMGDFACSMPDYKILAQEREMALKLVRMVCTKEIDVQKAINIVSDARAELVNTRKLIKL